MAGITQAQAQAQLDAWMAASLAVAQGQEYEIAGRRLKRADASEIREQVKFWETRVKRLAGGGLRVYGATPE